MWYFLGGLYQSPSSVKYLDLSHNKREKVKNNQIPKIQLIFAVINYNFENFTCLGNKMPKTDQIWFKMIWKPEIWPSYGKV